MPPKSYTLHLMHQSLNVFKSEGKMAADVRWALSKVGPDAIGWTEFRGLNAEVREICHDHGYRMVAFPQNDNEAFAIRTEVLKLKDRGTVMVSPRVGNDSAQYVNWLRLKLDDETVWYHNGHWIPKLRQLEPGGTHRHNEMTRQMVAQVRKHAQGRNLSFFSGDINIDDQAGQRTDYNRIMRQGGLLTVWDEFKVWPGTMSQGGNTLDVIGSYNRDKRIKALRYKLHPKRNSDHRPLSTWYQITRARVDFPGAPGGGGGGGGHGGGGGDEPPVPGPDPTQDDFYATGGNINWSDYFDDAIYNLPQATDDSEELSERFGVSD